MNKEIIKVSIDILKVHPRNSEFFDDIQGKEYKQFKESIKNDGLLTPILVSPDMTVISGHQRLKACKELGVVLVPVMIREDLTDENEKLKLLLAANFGRVKNDDAKQRKIAVEYVNLCGYKHGEIGGGHQTSDNRKSAMKQNEIASQLGVSVTTLNEILAIERKLTPEMKELLDKDKLFSKTTASKIISKLSSIEQEELIQSLPITEKLTQKQVQEYVNQLKTKQDSVDLLKQKYIELQEQLKQATNDHQKQKELEQQIERLKKRIVDLTMEKDSIEKQKTKTVVERVEVDKPETLQEIKDLRNQLQKKTEDNRTLSNMNTEQAQMLSRFMGTSTEYQLVSHCSEITLKMLNFVKDMAQYDYMADTFNSIPLATRTEYARCIRSVKQWADNILQTIEIQENRYVVETE